MTATACPRAASAAGRAPHTSPSPPVLLHGETSAVRKTTVMPSSVLTRERGGESKPSSESGRSASREFPLAEWCNNATMLFSWSGTNPVGVQDRSAASSSAGRTGPTKAGSRSDSGFAGGADDGSVTVARGVFDLASRASDPPRATRQRGACAPTHLPSWRRYGDRRRGGGAARRGPRPAARGDPRGLGLALAPRHMSRTPIHRDSLSARGKTCGDDIAARARVARARTTRKRRARRSEGRARATRPE